MGIYFNPEMAALQKTKISQLYIDKTGLIEYLNRVICTNANCISVSHARRFGKSHAAGMIDAYYQQRLRFIRAFLQILKLQPRTAIQHI